ncbi:MAG: Rieske 2Fe-2S domain-containing protein [Dehalococcoidia bacterium]|nr:Rieske 2Fe-2S domain-containing protein [Dehalococcoidia bacterium]
MLSAQDTQMLTRVGFGTPMGDLLRRYWNPVLLSSELPAPDCNPIRVKLLGENLVAFRDTSGQVGLIADRCPHRGASLFFGRNEEGGLRCVYHGWKYDVEGRCLDQPNEPETSNFKDKFRHIAYPCVEKAGMVWAYMGPRALKPAFPEYPWNLVPEDHVEVSKRVIENNWMQSLEGGIDSSHVAFLHNEAGQRQARNPDPCAQSLTREDRAPRFELMEIPAGVLIAAQRNAPDNQYYWRINIFMLPFWTAPPGCIGPATRLTAWEPMDDFTLMRWNIYFNPERPLTPEERAQCHQQGGIDLGSEEYLPATQRPGGAFYGMRNKDNDYMLDRELQRAQSYTGIVGIGTQDQAMTETMMTENVGPVLDRTLEHLGTSDSGVIAARRILLRAARKLRDDNIAPPGTQDPAVFRYTAAGITLPREESWVEAAQRFFAAPRAMDAWPARARA